MCLSTVYRNEKNADNIVLQNVMLIECEGGKVKLTDILGREAVLDGELKSADLTGATVIVRTLQ